MSASNFKALAATVGVALGACGGPAHAYDSIHVRVDYTWQVVDLAPDDGVAAGVTFGDGGASDHRVWSNGGPRLASSMIYVWLGREQHRRSGLPFAELSSEAGSMGPGYFEVRHPYPSSLDGVYQNRSLSPCVQCTVDLAPGTQWTLTANYRIEAKRVGRRTSGWVNAGLYRDPYLADGKGDPITTFFAGTPPRTRGGPPVLVDEGSFALTLSREVDADWSTVYMDLSANTFASAAPEPSTWALWAFGLAGTGVVARRRRARAHRVSRHASTS